MSGKSRRRRRPCSHSDRVKPAKVRATIQSPDQWCCSQCQTTMGARVCLSCGSTFCSNHFRTHWSSTGGRGKHNQDHCLCLALNVEGKSVQCLRCRRMLDDEGDQPAVFRRLRDLLKEVRTLTPSRRRRRQQSAQDEDDDDDDGDHNDSDGDDGTSPDHRRSSKMERLMRRLATDDNFPRYLGTSRRRRRPPPRFTSHTPPADEDSAGGGSSDFEERKRRVRQLRERQGRSPRPAAGAGAVTISILAPSVGVGGRQSSRRSSTRRQAAARAPQRDIFREWGGGDGDGDSGHSGDSGDSVDGGEAAESMRGVEDDPSEGGDQSAVHHDVDDGDDDEMEGDHDVDVDGDGDAMEGDQVNAQPNHQASSGVEGEDEHQSAASGLSSRVKSPRKSRQSPRKRKPAAASARRPVAPARSKPAKSKKGSSLQRQLALLQCDDNFNYYALGSRRRRPRRRAGQPAATERKQSPSQGSGSSPVESERSQPESRPGRGGVAASGTSGRAAGGRNRPAALAAPSLRQKKPATVLKLAYLSSAAVARRSLEDKMQTAVFRWRFHTMVKVFQLWLAEVRAGKTGGPPDTATPSAPPTVSPAAGRPSVVPPSASPAAHTHQHTPALPLSAVRTSAAATPAASPRSSKRPLQMMPGGCGLRNLGNTCYINSVVQALAHTPHARHYFAQFMPSRVFPLLFPAYGGGGGSANATEAVEAALRSEDEQALDVRLSEDVSNLMRVLWQGKRIVFTPDRLLRTVWERFSKFMGFKQQDAQEFALLLLGRLAQEEKRMRAVLHRAKRAGASAAAAAAAGAGAAGDTSGERKDPMTQDLLFDDFQASIRAQIRCEECGHVSNRETSTGGVLSVVFPSPPRTLPVAVGSRQTLKVSKRQARAGQGHWHAVADPPRTPSTRRSRPRTQRRSTTPLSPSENSERGQQDGPWARECCRSYVTESREPQLPGQSDRTQRQTPRNQPQMRKQRQEPTQAQTARRSTLQTTDDGSDAWPHRHSPACCDAHVECLEDCLQATFGQQDAMTGADRYSCPQCKRKQPATRSYRVSELPPKYLIVHLIRMSYDPQSLKPRKIQRKVNFPLRGLNLTPWVHQDPSSDDNSDTGRSSGDKGDNGGGGGDSGGGGVSPLWDLYAVVSHAGRGMNEGHFTCYARHADAGAWFLYNDAKVSRATEQEVLDAQGYLLFYQRRGVANELPGFQARPPLERPFTEAEMRARQSIQLYGRGMRRGRLSRRSVPPKRYGRRVHTAPPSPPSADEEQEESSGGEQFSGGDSSAREMHDVSEGEVRASEVGQKRAGGVIKATRQLASPTKRAKVRRR